jgi:hypothetical protein
VNIPSVIKYITLSIIHPSIWKSSSSPNPRSSCHSQIQWSAPPKIATNQPNEKRDGGDRKIGRERKREEREGGRRREVVTHYHLSQRAITGDIVTHGKLCVQAEGYSAPTAHHHLPIPRSLGLNVISISERWRHAHSLKAISPHNSSQRDIKHPLERMSAKIALQRRKGGKDRNRKRAKEQKRESKIHLSVRKKLIG